MAAQQRGVMTTRKAARKPPGLVHVAAEGRQLALPGMLWPAGRARTRDTPLFFEEIDKAAANDLIDSWGHPLGPYNRPFGFQAWGLAIDGVAVAVAVSGSTVGTTSAGYRRMQVVELARIARSPDHPGVMRVMLRLWRDYFGARWDGWDAPVAAAVSYALPGKEGNLYRFDGWEFFGWCKPWQGGANWSNPSKANELGDGKKKLYRYEYASAARDIHALLSGAGFVPGIKPTKKDPGRACPGFRVISPAPGAARVRYYSVGKAPAFFAGEMLAAYAEAIAAAGYAVMTDSVSGHLAVAAATPPGPAGPRQPSGETQLAQSGERAEMRIPLPGGRSRPGRYAPGPAKRPATASVTDPRVEAGGGSLSRHEKQGGRRRGRNGEPGMEWTIGQQVTLAECDPEDGKPKPGGRRVTGTVEDMESVDGLGVVAVDAPGLPPCKTFLADTGLPWLDDPGWCLLPGDEAAATPETGR